MGSGLIPATIYQRLEVDILRLKLQLPAKAGQLRISECEAVRLLTLPAKDFQAFLNWPQKEKCWDMQPPYYDEEHGKRIYRGVLILGEGHEDGVFAYDAGEHFSYLPGARAVVDSILEQAAEKIIREGTENTNEGSWCYYFSELYEQMGLVIEEGNGFDALLLEKLEQRPETAEVTLTDECFDICYYLDYCKNLASERPAPSLSAGEKDEIISSILNYMAEYFDDSSLYDILHNTLGIRNDKIEALGFALQNEYVDEQMEADRLQSGHFPESGKLANLISAYEELYQLPDEERITHLAPGTFSYCLDPDVPAEQLHAVYQQALSALELKGDKIQMDRQFTSRDEIISRMRDCLLAKELSAGERVLFVATEPYGGPGDFALRGGVIESVDEQDKTCSVRGTFFTRKKAPLHYVLGRYNPAIGEEHYGFRGIVPYFCEDKELAEHYLHEAEVMWDTEMGEGQGLSM